MKTWIVLPAYNEELALRPLLSALVETLRGEKWDFEIVVVDDGSSDGTSGVINEFVPTGKVTLLRNPQNLGLAGTLQRGLIEACGRAENQDVLITMDADNSHPAALALRMVREIREGRDVVIASRFQRGARTVGVPRTRKIWSWGASWLFRILFPTPGVRDFTCGYRAYRVGPLREHVIDGNWKPISNRSFSCMVDILLQLRRGDLIFGEVPLVLRYDLKPGRSNMRVGRTIYETLQLAIRRKLGLTPAL